MCQNSSWIRNKYLAKVRTGYRAMVYASCGHCKECLQEKANRRAMRIQKEFDRKDIMCLFVTLTYDNKYIPYFYKSDADNFFKAGKIPALPIRRDFSRHLVRVPHYEVTKDKRYKDQEKAPLVVSRKASHYTYEWSCTYPSGLIDTLNFDLLDSDEIQKYYDLYNKFDNNFNGLNVRRGNTIIRRIESKVPVLYYRDVQNFFKRFRKRLNKGRSHPIEFRFFAAGEYGETYQRPHWHILLFFDPKYRGYIEECIYSSWAFCNLRELPDSVEPALNPAHYVASYVNCSADIPAFLAYSKAFKPSWHYSKVFGFDDELFSFEKVSQAIDKGNLQYDIVVNRNGKPTSLSVHYPKYVLNRYFPKYRGFSLLTASQLYQLCDNVYQSEFDKFVYNYIKWTPHLDIELNEVFKIYDSLKRRISIYGSDKSYIDRYSRVWSVRSSNLLHTLHDEVDILQCYDNLECSVYGKTKHHYRHSVLGELYYNNVQPVSLDPHDFPINRERSNRLIDQYDSTMKRRKVLCDAYAK